MSRSYSQATDPAIDLSVSVSIGIAGHGAGTAAQRPYTPAQRILSATLTGTQSTSRTGPLTITSTATTGRVLADPWSAGYRGWPAHGLARPASPAAVAMYRSWSQCDPESPPGMVTCPPLPQPRCVTARAETFAIRPTAPGAAGDCPGAHWDGDHSPPSQGHRAGLLAPVAQRPGRVRARRARAGAADSYGPPGRPARRPGRADRRRGADDDRPRHHEGASRRRGGPPAAIAVARIAAWLRLPAGEEDEDAGDGQRRAGVRGVYQIGGAA